jgi:hypothetical protein
MLAIISKNLLSSVITSVVSTSEYFTATVFVLQMTGEQTYKNQAMMIHQV